MSYMLTPTNALAKAGSREVCVSMGSHFLLRAHFDRLQTDVAVAAPSGALRFFWGGFSVWLQRRESCL